MGMTKLEAKFRIVTPLFMGGAKPEIPELRVPGIKGALRFWWRAMAYRGLSGDLKTIRELEGQIFGSTKHGQSRAIMEISQEKLEPNGDQFFRGRPGLMYLGYGPIEKGELGREYLKPPIDATLRIYIRTNCNNGNNALGDSEVVNQISSALKAMGLFGGLGSRSRRGFRSFNLSDLKRDGNSIFEQPSSVEDLKKRVREILEGSDRHKELPEYTAFGSETAVYIYHIEYADPIESLNEIGKMMLQYRVGTGGHPSKFNSDTDLAKKALTMQVDRHPQRIFFGLPHNYHFPKRGQTGQTLEVRPISYNRNVSHDRRASPLFIHIHELKNRKYAVVATLMPAIFLPEGDKILMKRQKKGKSGPESLGSEVQFDVEEGKSLKVIRDFLDSKWETVIPA